MQSCYTILLLRSEETSEPDLAFEDAISAKATVQTQSKHTAWEHEDRPSLGRSDSPLAEFWQPSTATSPLYTAGRPRTIAASKMLWYPRGTEPHPCRSLKPYAAPAAAAAATHLLCVIKHRDELGGVRFVKRTAHEPGENSLCICEGKFI